MRKPSKKILAIAAVTVLMLGGAGAAYAYWTAQGTGTGTGTTGTSQAINVVQTSTVTNLRPGGAPQALSGTFTNLNSAPVSITSVTATVASTSNVGCTAADYVIAGTITFTNPVDTGSAWSGATIAFLNSASLNQDACKNATVNISYSVQ
ncbi:MAG: hypothetical protein ABJB03_05865 [Rhodoglobus sp.]